MSTNEEVDGIVRHGFDYDLQVWVEDYVIQDCGHKTYRMEYHPGCDACRYAGRDIRQVRIRLRLD